MLAKHASGIGVRVSEELLLREVERAALGGGALQAVTKLCVVENRDNQEAEVVQQTYKVRLLGLWVADFASQGLGNECAAERVTPEGIRVQYPFVGWDSLVHARAEKNRAHPIDTERHDGGADGFHRAASEKRRIGHSKALGCNRSVTRDELDYLFHSDVVDRQTHHGEQGLKDRGSGRDRIERCDPGF